MEEKRTTVPSINGLYDEKSEAVVMYMNDKKFCLKHDFINASLIWNKKTINDRMVEIPLESEEKKGFYPAWGNGYGGIRYCKKCKKIDCIHIWDNHNTYYIPIHSNFYGIEYYVSHCEICDKRILRSSCCVCTPNIDANILIQNVYHEVTGKSFNAFNFGSGFSIELPTYISMLLEDGKQDQAKRYLYGLFTSNSPLSREIMSITKKEEQK